MILIVICTWLRAASVFLLSCCVHIGCVAPASPMCVHGLSINMMTVFSYTLLKEREGARDRKWKKGYIGKNCHSPVVLLWVALYPLSFAVCTFALLLLQMPAMFLSSVLCSCSSVIFFSCPFLSFKVVLHFLPSTVFSFIYWDWQPPTERLTLSCESIFWICSDVLSLFQWSLIVAVVEFVFLGVPLFY